MAPRLYNEKNDILLSSTIAIALLSYLGACVLAGGFNFLGLRDSSVPALLFDITFFVLLFFSFLVVKNRITFDMLVILLIVSSLVTISYIFSPVNRPYIRDESTLLFLKCLPAFLLVRAIKNPDILLKYLYKTSYLLLFFGLLYFIFFSMSEQNRYSGYDMVFGYQLTVAVILLLSKFFKNGNKLDFALSISGMIMIIIKSSRGPILSIASFILLTILFGRMKLRKKIIYTLLLSIVSFILSKYQYYILQYFIDLLAKFNIYSRSLSLLQNNTITDSNGRDAIYNIIKERIQFNPFSGYGVYGDRSLLNGSYSHNFILEIFVQYGVVLGSVFLCVLLVLIVLGFKNTRWNELVIIFSSLVIVSSMISGSYLQSVNFWILLGLLLNARNNTVKSMPI